MNLIDYYQEWYECFYKNLELVKKTNPFLLNPEYKDRCETMLFGQEANEMPADKILSFNEAYTGILASYKDYLLKVLRYEQLERNGKLTRRLGNFEYLHLLLAGIDRKKIDNNNPKEIEKHLLLFNRILVNNINKVSSGGEYTKFNEKNELAFADIKNNINIYQAEIEYFRPKYLIFACGPSYAIQIERAFKVDIKNKRPTKNEAIADITDSFSNYKTVKKALYTYHPQNRIFSHIVLYKKITNCLS